MSFFEGIKKLTIILKINRSTWTYTARFWFSICHETKVGFLIILWWRTWIWIIIVCSSCFAFLLILLVAFILFAHIAWTFSLDVSLFATSKTSLVCRIKFINTLAIVPVWWLTFVPAFLLQKLTKLPCEQVESFTITALTWVLTIPMTNNS